MNKEEKEKKNFLFRQTIIFFCLNKIRDNKDDFLTHYIKNGIKDRPYRYYTEFAKLIKNLEDFKDFAEHLHINEKGKIDDNVRRHISRAFNDLESYVEKGIINE